MNDIHGLSWKFLSVAVMSAVLASLAGCRAARAERETESEAASSWAIEADYVDACSCDPACPCLYGSSPTEHHCKGATLVDIGRGHYAGVSLDGVRVVAAYKGGDWIKFYVGDNASEAQAKAVVELLPAIEDFFAIENVLEVARVPLTVTRDSDRVRFTVPTTTVEIEMMRGAGGDAIRTRGLPHPGFGKALEFLDHTQYRTVELEHRSAEQQFQYSGTTGYTARIDGRGE